MTPALLIVEDDLRLRRSLAQEFGERGYAVVGAAGAAEAAAALAATAFRFALVDLRLGADRGLDVVAAIHAAQPACRIVVLTGYGSIATAVATVKAGAAQYLTKPAPVAMIERALWTDLEAEAEPGEEGESLARREREYIEYVMARCDQNVTRAARWLGIHRQSLQRKLRKLPPP